MCESIAAERTFRCLQSEEKVFDTTVNMYVSNGQSNHFGIYYAADKRCKKGNELSREYFTLWKKQTFYKDENCDTADRSVEEWRFLCK